MRFKSPGGHREPGDTSFGKIESEIEQIGFFDSLPEALTYPEIQPKLAERVRKEKEAYVL